MVSLVFSPIWFFGFDSVFDFISIIITLLIGFYSYKIYKLTGKKSYFYLYIVFLLLGLGLVLKSFANLGMYYDLLHKLGVIDTRLFGYQITALALFTYVLTTLLGYIILVALTLKLQGKRIISLLFLLVFLTILLAKNSFMFFHLISFIIIMFYVMPYFYDNYRKVKTNMAFLVFTCFFLLGASHLLFALVFYSTQFYVSGVILQMVGYLMLLVNLILVHKQ
ncbi:hypothetical protein J4440_02540 [Candidatus Woesearchaeota archaeon]|nr:hypothetical protein [Candidatus Woesearchaeota archaeon]